MLVQLLIKNLAIIADTALDFAGGLNVLTGETGAGKSIIVGAMNLVLGDRARPDMVRSGSPRAEVQALFRVPAGSEVAARLTHLDLVGDDHDDDVVEILVRRIIADRSKGRVYVNDRLVTVKTLALLMRGMVDISSQHEHTTVFETSRHLGLLDAYGAHSDEREAFRAAFDELETARAGLAALAKREQARVEREDYVRFQLQEIDAVDPQPGEDDDLSQERSRLVHAERLLTGSRDVEDTLAGGERSVSFQLISALRSLERLVAVDEALQPLAGRLDEARIELEDVAMEVRRYSDQVELDPRRLETVEERLFELGRLKRKHGGHLDGVIARRTELGEEMSGFDSLEAELSEASATVERRLERATDAADLLSKARRRAAEALQTAVSRELSSLAMSGAEVEFTIDPAAELGPTGADDVRLQIRTNAGESFKPIARIASGGELSRILLAFKKVLTSVDPVSVSVFDEVDSGVGGAIAEAVGLKLKEISSDRQVVAITHLPQIAAHGAHHLRVTKSSHDGRTQASVQRLDADQRAEEIARMLGGLEITTHARAHAAELLDRTKVSSRSR